MPKSNLQRCYIATLLPLLKTSCGEADVKKCKVSTHKKVVKFVQAPKDTWRKVIVATQCIIPHS